MEYQFVFVNEHGDRFYHDTDATFRIFGLEYRSPGKLIKKLKAGMVPEVIVAGGKFITIDTLLKSSRGGRVN